MRKAILALCMLVLLLVPVTVFAAPPADNNTYATLPDNPQPWGDKHIPSDISDYIGRSSNGTDESGTASNEGAAAADSTITPMAASLPVAQPTKYSKSMKRNSDGWYYTSFEYTAPASGIYYFADLDTGKVDSDIYVYDAAGNRVESDASIDETFKLLVKLKAGYKYTIELDSYTNQMNYIMTTPLSLGNAAYTVKPNGYSYYWCQAFRFTVTKDQLYTFHINNPKNSDFVAGFFTADSEPYYGYSAESETYDYMFFEPGTYDFIMYMTNYSSNTASYTVAMDLEGNKHMDNGVTVSTTLAANDMLTSNVFEPETTGGHRFSCSRSDAKLSIMHLIQDDEGYIEDFEYTVKNVSANTRVNLVRDELYMVYLSTSGTPGAMTYSVTYLSPVSTLLGITVSAGTLSPAFNSSTVYYKLPIDSTTAKSVTITPKPTAVGGTLKIDGEVATSKTYYVEATSGRDITISYTSPDGSKTSVYYVHQWGMFTECAVMATDWPWDFDGYTLTQYAVNSQTSEQVTNVYVSNRASWKLYSDSACTAEIADKAMTLEEGLNRAYVKVTSEDGRNSAVYPLLVYRAALADPKIVAYNTSRVEITSGTVAKTSVVVKPMGTETLEKSVTKNGAVYSWPSGDLFTTDGVYAVSITDGNGATDSFSFTIDKTVPAIWAKDSASANVAKGGLTNKAVKVTVSDVNLNTRSAKKDNAAISWPAADTFTADGVYTVTANDKAGNSTTFTFTIDRTAPAISAAAGTTKLISNAYAKSNVVVTVSDTRLASKTVTKNGASFAWPSNNTFADTAVYVITAKDTAGNTSSFKFTIDKTMPVITAKAGGITVKSGVLTNKDVVLSVSESNLASKSATRNGAAFTWPSNSTFTQEGAYIAKAADRSGNAVIFAFNIDKVPVVSVKSLTSAKAIANNGFTNEGAVITITDTFLTSKAITKSGKSMSWPSGGKVTAEGIYVVTAKDKIGNSATLKFTVDKTAPSISVKTNSNKTLYNGGVTKESEVYAAITDVNKYTKSVTKDGKSMTFPSKFTAEGVYIITVTDVAGNKTTFKFVIDRIAPVISAKTAKGAVANNALVNQDVVIAVTDRVAVTKTITRNGAALSWPSSNTVTAEGKYVVTAKDSLGYSAAAFTFTIDKTGPSITAKNSSNQTVANNGATNKNVTVTVTGQTGAVTATKNNSFMTYPSGGVFTAEGIYAVTAADALGNKTTFKFTIDKTGPSITAKDSSDQAVANNGATNKIVTVTVTGQIGTVTATKNGSLMTYPSGGVFTAEGVYVVTASDALGNKTTFKFTIDKTGPAITGADGDDNPVSDGAAINEAVTVTVDVASKSVKKDSAPFEWPLDDTFSDDAVYVVTAADALGNISTYTFTIDTQAPVIAATDSDDADVTEGMVTNKDVTVVVTGDDGNPKAKQGGYNYEYPMDGVFSEDGVYVITAKDAAGNQATLSFTIDKISPEIQAVLTSDLVTGVAEGETVTDVEGVTLGIDEMNLDTILVTKDGVDYFKYPLADGDDESLRWDGSLSVALLDNGVYAVTITDKGGNTATLNFTIHIS